MTNGSSGASMVARRKPSPRGTANSSGTANRGCAVAFYISGDRNCASRAGPFPCFTFPMPRMKTKRIQVQSSVGSYSILCGAGALRQAARAIAELGRFSSAHFVSSPKVWRATGKNVQRSFSVQNPRAVHLIDDPESAKNLRTVEALCRTLIRSGLHRPALAYLSPRNLEIKAQVVSRDERESGLREILNFGHTFAHALESITHYKRYQHGEAVAWGMMAAALLGPEAGITGANDVSRIVSLVPRLDPPPPTPRVPAKALIDAMRSDKKSRDGNLRFVLTPRIGKAASYDRVPLDAVERIVHFAPHFFCDSERSRG